MRRIADLHRRVAEARHRRARSGRAGAYPNPRWGCSTCPAPLADVLVLIGVPSGELVQEQLCWTCFNPAEYPEVRFEVFPGRPRQPPQPQKSR